MTMGFVAVPSISSFTSAAGNGSTAFRQVASRARPARFSAKDEVVDTVEIDEIEDARDDRDRSEIMDSGLEREDAALATDGRRENGY